MKGKRRLPLVLALLLLLTLLPARATGTDRANTLAAGGQAHSLAVQEDGTVLVWGDNSAGRRCGRDQKAHGGRGSLRRIGGGGRGFFRRPAV